MEHNAVYIYDSIVLTIVVYVTILVRRPFTFPEQSEAHISDFTGPPAINQHVGGLQSAMVLYR